MARRRPAWYLCGHSGDSARHSSEANTISTADDANEAAKPLSLAALVRLPVRDLVCIAIASH